MSDHYFGINKGKEGLREDEWTKGSSSGSTDFEVRIADAAGLTRYDVVRILEALEAKILEPSFTDFPAS